MIMMILRICAWGLRDKVYLGPSPKRPDPQLTLYYGSRVGMYDDIASRQGLDTANAEITAKPSHDGAVKFCREMRGTIRRNASPGN